MGQPRRAVDGAAAGNDACICNVIRLSLRYANLSTLEEGYGINLIPLATFAMEAYKDDECAEFMPKMSGGAAAIDEKTKRLTSQMHKAIAIIQFKIEGQLIAKHPEWKMDKRRLFEHINYEKKEIEIDGKIYPMTSCHFPTINPASPYELSPEEMVLMAKLHHSFMVCEKLHKHIKVMLQHGCMYTIINNNLLFHASCPLNEDGSLKEVEIFPGKKFAGRDLMHQTGMQIRTAFQSDSDPKEREYAIDYFIYLWCGPDSPLFDKEQDGYL